MKTQEVQTDRWPARYAVGDVVHYRGRTYTVIDVAATQHGHLYRLAAPYWTPAPRGGKGTKKWTYASTYNHNGELS